MNEILNIKGGDKEGMEKLLENLNDDNKKIAAEWMVDHWWSALCTFMLAKGKCSKQPRR